MSIFLQLKQSIFGTPAWALEKISEARENKLQALDLSRQYNDSREALTKLPYKDFVQAEKMLA